MLGCMSEARRRCLSAILFAFAWPLPVYGLVGSVLIVVNERVLHRHIFPASQVAAVTGFVSLLLAAAWSDWHDRHLHLPGELTPKR